MDTAIQESEDYETKTKKKRKCKEIFIIVASNYNLPGA